MRVDVLFLAYNRLEFTTATWAWLIAHTNWDYVQKLIVYDDGSEDGTLEFLREAVGQVANAEFRVSDLRSPPAVMNHYLATSQADCFAKIDNDIALPGGWLEAMLSVMTSRKRPDLLGMQAGTIELAGRDGKKWDGQYRFEPASHIGGVGLMRVSAFRERPAIPSRGRFGFTEWQERYDPQRGWIAPDIHCVELDKLPFEPWLSLTEQYIENGWSRPWEKYHERWSSPYWKWMTAEVPA